MMLPGMLDICRRCRRCPRLLLNGGGRRRNGGLPLIGGGLESKDGGGLPLIGEGLESKDGGGPPLIGRGLNLVSGGGLPDPVKEGKNDDMVFIKEPASASSCSPDCIYSHLKI